MPGAFVAGSIVSHLILDTTKWNTSVKAVKGSTAQLGKQMAQTGAAFSKKLTVPIVGFAAASVKAFADFDKSMTESLAIMGKVSDETRAKMEATAKQLAGESVYSAKELGEAYYFLASAGMDAEQSIGALPIVTKFAQAGAFDLASATDLLTDAQSALGLTVADTVENTRNMIHVSDVLVGANTLANASVQQFSEALTNRAAASMRTVNMELEEGVAVLAAFADQGVKGQLAGNQFAIVMTNLETAARKNQRAWKQYGVELYDSEGNMRNMADVIGDMERAFGDLPPKQKAAALAQLGFNDRAAKSIKTLMGTSEKIREYERKLRDLGGITDEVAKKQMEAFSNQMKALKNDIVVVGIEFGQQLIPIIKDLVDNYVKPAVEWFKNLSEGKKKLIVQILLAVAAFGPLMSLFGKSLAIIPRMITQVKLLGTTTATLGGGLKNMHLVAAAAFIGWGIGRKIGQLKLLGKTIDEHVQDKFEGMIDVLGIVKVRTKELDDQTELLSKREMLLADASKIAGKEVTNQSEAIKILRTHYAETGEIGSKVMKDWNLESIKAEEKTKKLKQETKLTTEASKKFGDSLEKDVIPKVESYGKTIEKVATPPLMAMKLELNNLYAQLQAGTITWDEYAERSSVLKEDIKKLEAGIGGVGMAIEETEIDFEDSGDVIGGILKELGINSTGLSQKILDNFKNTTAMMETHWGDMVRGLSGAFGDFVFNVLSTGSTFTEDLKGLWEGVKNTFKNILADMAQEWMEKFLKSLITSALDAGNSIAGNVLGGLQKALSGGGGAAGAGGGGIGGLLGAGAGASPWGAIAMGVGSFLGGWLGGGRTKGAIDASNRELHNIWIEARELRNDNLGAIIPILTDIRNTLWDITNIIPMVDTIQSFADVHAALLNEVANHARDINEHTWDIAKTIGNLTKAQHGAKHMKPELAMVGEQAPRIPEYTLPEPMLEGLIARGTGTQRTQINLIVNNRTREINLTEPIQEIIIETVPELSADGRLKLNVNALTQER